MLCIAKIINTNFFLGSMSAAENLLKKAGVTVVECLVIMELKSLNGRAKIEAPIHALLQYD